MHRKRRRGGILKKEIDAGSTSQTADRVSKGGAITLDETESHPPSSRHKAQSLSKSPSSESMQGPFATAMPATHLTSEALTTALDGLSELPRHFEERRLMHEAFERLSSPGLGILTVSSASNAKMQALMLGGASLRSPDVLSSRPPTAGSSSPVGPDDRGGLHGLSHRQAAHSLTNGPTGSPTAEPSSHSSRGITGRVPPSEGPDAAGLAETADCGADGTAGTAGPGSTVGSTDASRVHLHKVRRASASPFASAFYHFSPEGVQDTALQGKKKVGNESGGRQQGSASYPPPGATLESQALRRGSVEEEYLPLPPSASTPPRIAGQLARRASAVELELDFDRCGVEVKVDG